MTEDLALHRWAKSGPDPALALPADALQACLADLADRRIRSVYILTVNEDGMQGHYSAGPQVGSFQQVWGVLQLEALQMIARMTG